MARTHLLGPRDLDKDLAQEKQIMEDFLTWVEANVLVKISDAELLRKKAEEIMRISSFIMAKCCLWISSVEVVDYKDDATPHFAPLGGPLPAKEGKR